RRRHTRSDRDWSSDVCSSDLAPHGATVSEPYRDVDGHWLSELRRRVGPDVPIIGTLDAHANLSQAMVDAADALIAYRTNPHLDQIGRASCRERVKSSVGAG